MSRYYAGVGSRDTPEEVLRDMTAFARYMEDKAILRSGGAAGADTAFEAGVVNPSNKEIYLPWFRFNNNTSDLCNVTKAALNLARKYHPRFSALSHPAKMLMARNGYQILGQSLIEPVEFVVCYTADGCESYVTRTRLTGGTGQAIEIASRLNVPVFNLFRKDRLKELYEYVEENF